MHLETTMIPGVMMMIRDPAPPENENTLENWSYQNFKKKNNPESFTIQAVKCVVDGEEKTIPFEAFALHLNRIIDRIGVGTRKNVQELHKKYPIGDLYDDYQGGENEKNG